MTTQRGREIRVGLLLGGYCCTTGPRNVISSPCWSQWAGKAPEAGPGAPCGQKWNWKASVTCCFQASRLGSGEEMPMTCQVSLSDTTEVW